jgi:hypothetical protein
VGVGSDGTIYALNLNDEVFVREADAWRKIDGYCRQISVADINNVMCTSKENDVWRRVNNQWIPVSTPAKFRDISISSTN